MTTMPHRGPATWVLADLMAAVCVCAVTACVDLPNRTLADTSRTVLRHSAPEGPLQARLTPHSDDGGWTIQIGQPTRQTLEEIRETTKETTRFSFFPPAIMRGLLGCPAAILREGRQATQPATGDQHGIRDACLSLLMLERSDSPHTLTVRKSEEQRTVTEEMPVSGGRVMATWERCGQTFLVSSVSADGTARVRLSRLATLLLAAQPDALERCPGPVTLAAHHRDIVIGRWPVDVPSTALQAALNHAIAPIPPDHWPTPLVFRIDVVGDPAAVPTEIESRVTSLFLANGFRLVAGAPTLPRLDDEQERQHSGRTADLPGFGPGHWLGATVMVTIEGAHTPNQKTLTLRLTTVQTGRTLAVIPLEASPDAERALTEAAMACLEELLGANQTRSLETVTATTENNR